MKEQGLNIVNAFLHLFYPETCIACHGPLDTGETLICIACLHGLPETGFHKFEGNPVERVFWGRFPLSYGAAYLYFEKAAGVQDIMHHIKYRGGKKAAEMLGARFGRQLYQLPQYKNIDCIIPVPLHDAKLKARGYNQSEWFAKGLSMGMAGLPLNTTSLYRIKNSETQTRKTREERWKNVSEIFGIREPALLRNKHILLVDDVITTGATLEACAQTILALNCGNKISIATLAFAS
jgi:ComF family protein